MSRDEITRRNFLIKLSAATGLSLGAGSILAACGGGESGQTAATDAGASGEMADACSDVSALTDQEKALRTSLQYTSQSPKADQHCANCQLFVAPEGNAPCGTCTLVKGPIAPTGYCTSWAAKQPAM